MLVTQYNTKNLQQGQELGSEYLRFLAVHLVQPGKEAICHIYKAGGKLVSGILISQTNKYQPFKVL